jgi:hypothetical protein
MATLTPRQQIERLAIGDKPIYINGRRIERVGNRLYDLNGVHVGSNGRMTLCRALDAVMASLDMPEMDEAS